MTDNSGKDSYFKLFFPSFILSPKVLQEQEYLNIRLRKFQATESHKFAPNFSIYFEEFSHPSFVNVRPSSDSIPYTPMRVLAAESS